jgi:hypothetical protein
MDKPEIPVQHLITILNLQTDTINAYKHTLELQKKVDRLTSLLEQNLELTRGLKTTKVTTDDIN